MTSAPSILFDAVTAKVKADHDLPLTPQEQKLLDNRAKIAAVAEKVIEAQKPCLAVRAFYWTVDHPFTIAITFGAVVLPSYAWIVYAIDKNLSVL